MARPCGETLKIKRNVNCHSQDHPRWRPYSIRFYPSPVTQKEHRIWHTMGEHRPSVARHSLTNTRKASRNVHEPRHYIRATGLLHFRVQLNRPRGSTRFSGIIVAFVKRRENVDFILQFAFGFTFRSNPSGRGFLFLSIPLSRRLF